MKSLKNLALKSTNLALALWLAGCSQSVEEDRSINFSNDGSGVAFQHGDEGVFVASSNGRGLEKVHDTSDDTIAVSAPLWSPVDGRLIFTLARSAMAESQLTANMPEWDAHPEGRPFMPEDTVYTCMLRPAPEDESTSPAVALFEATCDHPGYIAANLAVRWHPAGDRILFLDRTESGQHGLFEFDLATKARKQILPHSADALIFDWAAGGSYLVCVLANAIGNSETDGIWIRPEAGDAWWLVPQSGQVSVARPEAILEQLRAIRPVWTQDEGQFAFVAPEETHAADGDSQHCTIVVVDPESREAKVFYESSAPLSDLHWEPKTNRLGFVEAEAPPVLRIVDQAGVITTRRTETHIRRFAGWNHDGSRMAFVVPEPASTSVNWARLFLPVPDARDRVFIADGGVNAPAAIAHSGVRITFPQWSPTADSLSLWGTYTPTHRSLLSAYLPLSLRLGDPAAVLDCDSGEITWMAVNAHEQAQVGHYYLMRREYENAWKWYELAATDRAKPQAIKLSEIEQFMRQIRIHRDSNFFEYYCLTKLGRYEQAEMRLTQFRTAMSFEIDMQQLSELGDQWQGREEEARQELVKLVAFAEPLIQSAYITEVFLSLNATQDGLAFFERELESATDNPWRLAALLSLSQLLLISNEHEAYSELATSQLAPLLVEMLKSSSLTPSIDFTNLIEQRSSIQDFIILTAGSMALRPMASQEFLAGLSNKRLHSHVADWRELDKQTQNDAGHWIVDSALATLLQPLEDDEFHRIEARRSANPLKAMLEFVDRLSR